jgi:hypothetical protein
MEKTEAFIRGGTFLKNKDNRIHQIEIQLINIQDMQIQLSKSITDLTTASAIHQIASTVVNGVLYIRAFLSLSAGYTLMKTKEAVTIVTENGYRGTAIKNFSDFASAEAKRAAVKASLVEARSNFYQAIGNGSLNALASKMLNDLANASELSLFLDALGSGKGTLEQLYQINDTLDREYNNLCKERYELMRHK